MISNQILQNTIDGLKNITRRDFTIVDREGKVVVTTENNLNINYFNCIEFFINSPAENQLIQGYQYFKIFDNNIAEYTILTKGDDEETYQLGKLTAFQIQNLLVAYKEKYEKDNFIKNLLLDNLLLVDIYSRAKKLRIENDVKRIIYLVETDTDKELNAVDIIRSLFKSKNKDFVTAVDERRIIIVKELRDDESKAEIEQFASEIYNRLLFEGIPNVYVAIGSIVYDLKNISFSFKEANMALEVGKIFRKGKYIINYDNLGIGRLIYQLPINICKIFIDEVLKNITIDQFDEETLTTVDKFFENNLNVSETSRQLYIHRNTLVYRLDKIQKITNLDLRNFDDAIVFKIILMVTKYMKYRNTYKY